MLPVTIEECIEKLAIAEEVKAEADYKYGIANALFQSARVHLTKARKNKVRMVVYQEAYEVFNAALEACYAANIDVCALTLRLHRLELIAPRVALRRRQLAFVF